MEVLDEVEKPSHHHHHHTEEACSNSHDGPIQHKSVIKLASLDVVANFCVTWGFSIIGSGVCLLRNVSCLSWYSDIQVIS